MVSNELTIQGKFHHRRPIQLRDDSDARLSRAVLQQCRQRTTRSADPVYTRSVFQLPRSCPSGTAQSRNRQEAAESPSLLRHPLRRDHPFQRLRRV